MNRYRFCLRLIALMIPVAGISACQPETTSVERLPYGVHAAPQGTTVLAPDSSSSTTTTRQAP